MPKNLKAPAQGPGRKPVVQPSGEPQYERMVAAHLIVAAPGRYLENSKFEASMGRATYDLYERLAPRDAQELNLIAAHGERDQCEPRLPRPSGACSP